MWAIWIGGLCTRPAVFRCRPPDFHHHEQAGKRKMAERLGVGAEAAGSLLWRWGSSPTSLGRWRAQLSSQPPSLEGSWERRGGAAGTKAAAVGEDGGEHLVRYEGSREKGSG